MKIFEILILINLVESCWRSKKEKEKGYELKNSEICMLFLVPIFYNIFDGHTVIFLIKWGLRGHVILVRIFSP